MFTPEAVAALNEELHGCEPAVILERIHSAFPRLALAFSGAEDVVLVHMAAKLTPCPSFISLDTGRLHPQTLAFIERVREQYELPLQVLHPDSNELDNLIKNKGLYSFYKDGHKECCSIRKVAPLQRALLHFDAWITGQRRDQSPTRKHVPVIELDNSFSTAEHQIVKVNPLANWSSRQVWEFIRALEIPYNPLHDLGFASIGCEPCTRAIGPNQHEREGRWWWEESTIRECGLHRGNLEDD